jgi:hypothetical protein
MSDGSGGKWPTKVMNALVVLLAVALGARAAWELLAPLAPLLILLVGLGLVYAVIFGKFR